MEDTNAPVGRREAHKQATRAALQLAAEQLFAERGYEATTVRDIAAAAQVTERTFYRYFDGKEGLLAEQALVWMEAVQDAIRQRPPNEAPLVAVERALLAVVGQAAAEPLRMWQLLQRATPRPLRRLEESIATAVLPRFGSEDSDAELQAQLVARVAVVALRSAANERRRLRERDSDALPGIEQLLEDTFAMIATLIQP